MRTLLRRLALIAGHCFVFMSARLLNSVKQKSVIGFILLWKAIHANLTEEVKQKANATFGWHL